MAEREGIRFVRHADALQPTLARIFKRIADDPLHSLARIQILLRRNLVRRSLLKETAHPHVKALSVLAEHDEVHILLAAVLEWRESLVKQYARPSIHVQVEFEPQAKQNVGGMHIGGDSRIAHGSEQNRIEVAMKHLHGITRQSCPIPKVAVRAPIEFRQR